MILDTETKNLAPDMVFTAYWHGGQPCRYGLNFENSVI